MTTMSAFARFCRRRQPDKSSGDAIRRTVSAFLLALVFAAAPAWADYDAGKRAMDAGRVAEALEQWRAAAASEDRRAMLALGRLFVRGLGVPQNYVRAHMWLNLAAARGEAAAAQERDALAAKMTPSERAEAQKLALDWRPGEAAKDAQTAKPAAQDAPAGPPPPRAIRQAQALLAALGYKPGPADGKWGRRTGSAYAAFLRDAGLPPAETLTPQVLGAMRRVAARQGTVARPAPSPDRPVARTLVRAVRDGDIDAMNAALKAGVDPNGRDGRGWTALMHAANKGYRLLVPKLLEAQADPDVQTADGATALFLAVLRGHEEIAEMLVRAGADTAIEGPRRKTAIDVARTRQLKKTVVLIEEARADRKVFMEAREADTAEAYRTYLFENPKGGHHAEARTRLREIGRQTRRVLNRANVQSGPGKQHQKTGLLEPGDEVRVAARSGEWLQIQAKDSAEAFVHASLVAAGALEPKCTDVAKGAGCWREVTNRPGCHLWNSHLADEETATWSGRCVDGKLAGTGKLSWKFRQDGKSITSTNEGEMVDGVEFGRWVARSAAPGYIGEGPYVNGKRHGRWVVRWADGSSQEGPYVNGKRHGRWVVRWADGSSQEGPYVNGKRHGRWVTRLASGSEYEQEYRDGSREGQPGVYVTSSGIRHPGKWSGGCFLDHSGRVLMSNPNKTKQQCEAELGR